MSYIKLLMISGAVVMTIDSDKVASEGSITDNAEVRLRVCGFVCVACWMRCFF